MTPPHSASTIMHSEQETKNSLEPCCTFVSTDHCLRRVENRLQEPDRPVRLAQSSCATQVSSRCHIIATSLNSALTFSHPSSPHSGISCTFSSTSCSWSPESGLAFCSTRLSSATTSTGMIHDNLTIGSHAQRYFPNDQMIGYHRTLYPWAIFSGIPVYSQVHEPPGDVRRRPLRSHLHHECRHIEQVPGAKLWYYQMGCF